jgi:hypothetical protein
VGRDLGEELSHGIVPVSRRAEARVELLFEETYRGVAILRVRNDPVRDGPNPLRLARSNRGARCRGEDAPLGEATGRIEVVLNAPAARKDGLPLAAERVVVEVHNLPAERHPRDLAHDVSMHVLDVPERADAPRPPPHGVVDRFNRVADAERDLLLLHEAAPLIVC